MFGEMTRRKVEMMEAKVWRTIIILLYIQK